MGAITGMKSRESSSWMISGSMRTTSPTRPTSIFFFLSSLLATLSLRAWMKWPSLPVRPTALPPALLMSVTMSWLMRPPRTISTTSSVSSSVTRMPWMNSLCLPSFCSSAPICGPGAVHHHRVHADQLEQHHVLGEVLLQRHVGHRVAAVLDHDGAVVELADVRQGLDRGPRPSGRTMSLAGMGAGGGRKGLSGAILERQKRARAGNESRGAFPGAGFRVLRDRALTGSRACGRSRRPSSAG